MSNNDTKSAACEQIFTLEPDSANKVFTLMATPDPGLSKNHSTFRDVSPSLLNSKPQKIYGEKNKK